MQPKAPQIGFDRFIRLDWAAAALRVRSGAADIGELDQILTEAHAGPEAKKKTRTVLNRLWLEPREEVVGLADRGVDIFARVSNAQVEVLTWGMAIAVYPFFAKVAEIVGRLTAIQGDCTTAEVHRCSIPDDHIDPRRSALFMARSILREVRDGDTTC